MLEEYVFRGFFVFCFLLCALVIKPCFILNFALSLDALKYCILWPNIFSLYLDQNTDARKFVLVIIR